MASENLVKRLDQRPMKEAILNKNQFRILGLSADDLIRYFFAGNAWVAIVVLGLITFSLFNEGWRFFPQYNASMEVDRKAGLEYVNYAKDQLEAHADLVRFLNEIRAKELLRLQAHKTGEAETQAIMAPYNKFVDDYTNANIPLDDFVNEMSRIVTDVKERHIVAIDNQTTRDKLLAVGKNQEAAAVSVEPVNFAAEIATLKAKFPEYQEVNRQFAANLNQVLASAPAMTVPELQSAVDRVKKTTEKYIAGFPGVEKKMQDWQYDKPIPFYASLLSFVFDKKWTTQSFWQDTYGIVPLFAGSLCISIVALGLAVPFGVCSAIYVNQLASVREQNFIKPYIEFISAIPSVVLGFFGIAVLGEGLRWLSQQEWMSWVSFFPFAERLNIATAGILLGLIAVPTIFTLTEDALNNVPRHFKEASFALGANKFQTIVRILVPASISGIISAVLLGFGRVLGETMVVLLVAGNRIAIPDFSLGLGAFFQPVHTMVGLVAQEIPEVVKGSLQYRALFMLSITLFLIAMAINYAAQIVVKKYKVSVG